MNISIASKYGRVANHITVQMYVKKTPIMHKQSSNSENEQRSEISTEDLFANIHSSQLIKLR